MTIFKELRACRNLFLAAVLSALSLSLVCLPQAELNAAEETALPASGTCGTCTWDVSADGVMTIHAGVLDDWGGRSLLWRESP